ncbi:hypothetical protein PFICI_02058 [Pestalotiopsis fici W106-1]|uniref:Uncharacterized protein n=1 Tax=Pestalotiopsis fici (strain W106-1 / CGMCC3.15140) TaxID=1229662 RepID=W3XQK2_PESFW|nr:uncharacterized protein PFICI_02058 [Pestalotiopsis fici W106-1]ETS88230.1 hypothetical protein PFICI_02058 [Pestalotiopsis fici W106-1]
MDPSTTNVFNTINPQVHRLKRRLVSQLLTPTSIRSLEPIITEQIDLFVKQLSTTSTTKTGAESAVNMSRRCKYLGLDIAALLAFGYNLRLQTEEEHRYLPRAIARGSWIINLYMQLRFLKTIKFGIPIYVPAIIKGEAFLPTLRKMIKARLAEDRYARVDLYSHLADALQASGDEKITLSELWAEAIFFLPAAGDTSSTALSSLFFYLARNPECQKTVAKEIRSTFTAGDDIKSGQKLANCQYLHACINEALRLSPPVAGTVWREQSLESAKELLIIDGRVIPQGTQVGVNIYSIHHNPDYFPEPFAYKPERWLPSSSTESSEKASNTAAFMPFGAGSRACAGKPLAYLEVGMALAKTLWYFDFDFAQSVDTSGSNHDTEFRLKDVFTSDHDGPFLQFTPRGDFYKEL